MNLKTLGAIIFASTLTLACTTTTETVTTEPGPDTPSTKPDSFKSKLALSKASRKSIIGTLAGKAGQQTGGTHLKSGAPGGGSCGLSSGDPTCDSCLDTSCCAENKACVADPDCNALIACGDACTDDACISACMSAHPTGANLLDGLMRCVEGSCTSECGGGGGGGGGGSPSACGFYSGDATCDSCLDTNCCADANACLGDADCTALLDCAERCADDACVSACESAHPSGAALLGTLETCADTTCGSACSGAGGGGGGGGGGGSCGLTSGDPTCDTCLDASCCAQTTTCIGDPDCVDVVRCYDGCADSACASACDAAHPTGSAELGAVLNCAETSCAAACGF